MKPLRTKKGSVTARTRAALLLLFLLGLFAVSAAGKPEMDALKEELELSPYPSGWLPPPFTSHTATGRKVALGDYRGRLVLITFWATWCPPCLEEMPAFEQLHRDFGPQGLTVLGVNVREAPERVRRFAEKTKVTFPLIMDPSGRITKDYGVIGLPTAFLIGRDGRPIALAVGERKWNGPAARQLVRLLLAEPPRRREKR